MSENGRSQRPSGPKGNPTQIHDHRKKIQDEEDRLERIWEELDSSEEDGSDIDPEKFLWEMDILDRLNPIPDFDLKSWEDVREGFASLLDDPDSADQQSSASDLEKRPKRRRSRKSIQAVIALVLVLAMLAMVTSCGVLERILKAFGVDTEEIFSFEVHQALRVENPKPEPTDTRYYDTLEEALEDYGVTTAYADLPLPSGYVTQMVQARERSDSIKFFVIYECGNDEIFYTIWHYNDSTSLKLNAAEKLPSDAKIYTRGGIEYYIISNIDETIATWIVGTEKYTLSGAANVSQVKQMIDSIHEG